MQNLSLFVLLVLSGAMALITTQQKYEIFHLEPLAQPIPSYLDVTMDPVAAAAMYP